MGIVFVISTRYSVSDLTSNKVDSVVNPSLLLIWVYLQEYLPHPFCFFLF